MTSLVWDLLTTPLTTSTSTSLTASTSTSTSISTSTFQHETLIAALGISFCRYTVPAVRDEPQLLRLALGGILGYLTLVGWGYTSLCVVQLWSYLMVVTVVHLPLLRRRLGFSGSKGEARQGSKKGAATSLASLLSQFDHVDWTLLPALFVLTCILSHAICTTFANGSAQRLLRLLTPQSLLDLCDYLFPISELYRSYDLVNAFMDTEVLNARVYYLLFVTFNVQVGMGYLGIGFLKEEQMRRNQLVRMEIVEKDAEDAVDGEGEGEEDEVGEEQHEEDKIAEESIARRTRSARKAVANGTPSKSRSKRSNGIAKQNGSSSTTGTRTSRVRQKQLQTAATFCKSAAPFILFTVLPYMFQIIFYGNMNMFAFHCVRDEIHRELRVHGVFKHDAHLVAMTENSAMGPDAYAVSIDAVVSTTYDIFNRKLFSLPKLMLLPGVVMRQPMLLVKIFPFVFFTDFVKARFVAQVTSAVEKLDKEAKEIKAIRSKVEAFDLKNAELLQRSGFGATEFTAHKWEELTIRHQNKKIASELLKRSRTFFQWLQRNFIFVALIDCALAQLIAMGRIVSAEIFVFSRAIEDTVDLLLMRSRAESELATMLTEIDKLQELANVWKQSQERNLLPCHVAPDDESSKKGIVLQNLLYTRGTAVARVDHMEIPPGIYAVTGANGAGKSTLFRILMSCQTNETPIDLHPSISMETPKTQFIDSDLGPEDTCTVHDGCEVANGTANAVDENDASAPPEVPVLSIQMPSSDVAEISQNFYWPLYTKPIDWIYQEHLTDCNNDERERRLNRVTDELMSLAFSQIADDGKNKTNTNAASTVKDEKREDPITAARTKLFADLQEEKEDWFSDLSGGQKSKVELVRKVFLHDECPKVLLIDETMAPLDPASKSLVMGKIKAFCSESVVLVIYHTDVRATSMTAGNDGEEAKEIECVPSTNFFEDNLHVENRMLTRRPVCN